MTLTSGKYIIKIKDKDLCLSCQKTSGTYSYKALLFGTVKESENEFKDSNIFDVTTTVKDDKVMLTIKLSSRDLYMRYILNDNNEHFNGDFEGGMIFSNKKPLSEDSGNFLTCALYNQCEFVYFFPFKNTDNSYTLYYFPLKNNKKPENDKTQLKINFNTGNDKKEKNQLCFNIVDKNWFHTNKNPRKCIENLDLEFIPVKETFTNIKKNLPIFPFILILIIFIICYHYLKK